MLKHEDFAKPDNLPRPEKTSRPRFTSKCHGRKPVGVCFPVSRKELSKEKPGLSIVNYMGKGESVLVVDDVEEQREIASRILKRSGYSVKTVSSGEEAVDYMKNNSANLLLLDMIMDPGIERSALGVVRRWNFSRGRLGFAD
jgi:hypothetical protein